jgi:predicted nucleic acid-binding protein
VIRRSLEREIAAGARLLLDTTAVAAYLDAAEPTHTAARVILEELVAEGRNPAGVSAVTAMELLIRPLRATPPSDHAVVAFLEHHPHLDILPVDFEVALAAAGIRATLRFAPPDALVIGTAVALGIHFLVTNDFEWGRKLQGHLVDVAHAVRVITLAAIDTGAGPAQRPSLG